MPANEERICTLLYTNGVEIIAEILEMDNEFISIKAPFRIVQVQHQGQVGLTFVPAIISADENEMFATPFSSLMFLKIKIPLVSKNRSLAEFFFLTFVLRMLKSVKNLFELINVTASKKQK